MTAEPLQAGAGKGTVDRNTRSNLIQAGLELFSRFSFDGVSTRTLADHAGANLAGIQYHFGGKEGLYCAVAQHIVEQTRKWLDPEITRIEKSFEHGAPSREECFILVCRLLDSSTVNVLGAPDSKKLFGFTVREQVEPGAAFDIMYEGIVKPMHNCFCLLIGNIMDLPPASDETKLRAFGLMGQVVSFHIFSEDVNRLLECNVSEAERLDRIRRVIIDNAAAIVGMNGVGFCSGSIGETK